MYYFMFLSILFIYFITQSLSEENLEQLYGIPELQLFPAQSAKKINTRFLLYTRNNPHKYDLMKIGQPQSILFSHFNKNDETIFIIHGFMDNQVIGLWMQRLKNELLIYSQYNVIIVDWSGGNQIPYGQAYSNARVVGNVLANFTTELQNLTGILFSSVHYIGHSLGAHISGFAGEKLNKVGRITALDPAGPYFEDLPPNKRLDPTDAQFVDAIHTMTASYVPKIGYGFVKPLGHIDFYPNGGKYQPGCDRNVRVNIGLDSRESYAEELIQALIKITACDHHRAIEYLIASINFNENKPIITYKCQDYETFKKGDCNNCTGIDENCSYFGLGAIEWFKKFENKLKIIDQFENKMYFDTCEKYPFFC